MVWISNSSFIAYFCLLTLKCLIPGCLLIRPVKPSGSKCHFERLSQTTAVGVPDRHTDDTDCCAALWAACELNISVGRHIKQDFCCRKWTKCLTGCLICCYNAVITLLSLSNKLSLKCWKSMILFKRQFKVAFFHTNTFVIRLNK